MAHTEPGDALPDWFARLSELSGDARDAALAAAPASLRDRLRALLAADAEPDAPIDAALRTDAESVARPEWPGQRIGGWRVLRELGSGGMGTVLLAERDNAGFAQQAAIKLIRGFPTQEGMRRLRQERQILAALDHPDIARLIDGGETSAGQPYLVVEYVRGETLDVHLRRQMPDRDTRIALIERIGAAVQHAHQHLIIHRDLKPSNVMVADDGGIKLLDFGVAKLLDAGVNARDGSTRVFTPGYASPEQVAGQSVGVATDIYSLGAMLREAISDGPVNAELRGIIDCATATRVTDRYPTMAAFCDDLSRYRRGLPVRAASATPLYRLRKWVGRHRVATVFALLAAAAATVFIWRLQVERSRALAAEAIAARERDGARQSASLLQGIFARVAPGVALGRPIDTRAFIEATEAQLALQPDSAGNPAVALSVASIYQQLGEPARAAALLRTALRKSADTESHDAALQRAELYDELGSACFGLSDTAAARDAFDQAAALRQAHAPDDPQWQFRTLRNRGWVAYRSGHLDDAAAILGEALDFAKSHPALMDERIEDTLSALSDVTRHQGDLASADRYSADYLARIAAREAPGHPDHLVALRQSAAVLNSMGRMAEARSLLEQAIALHERTIGPTGARLADLENDLVTVLNDTGEPLVAISHAERALALTARDRDSPLDRAVSIMNLASSFENAGDYPRALALMTQAIAAYEAHAPDDADDRLRAEGNLARVLGLNGRFDEARARIASVRERLARSPEHPSWSWTFETLRAAQLERRAGRPDAAQALLDAAAAPLSRFLPDGHPAHAQVARIRGQIALDRGQFDQAQTAFAEAATLLGPHALALDQAIVASEQALVLAARGRRDDAARTLRPALDVLRNLTLPTEIHRARAERLARDLRMS